MKMPDVFDRYNGDDDDEPEGTACKFCGAEGFEWVHTGARWRLMDGKGLHVCPRVATPDDFEVLK